MKTRHIIIALLLLVFASCSSKQFAFRKTYDAAPAQKIAVHQPGVKHEDTIAFEKPVSIAVALPQIITTSPASVFHLVKSSRETKASAVHHPEKQTGIASDPIPPPAPVPPKEISPKIGTVALVLIITAYFMLALVAVGVQAALAFAAIFWLLGFIMSLVAITQKNGLIAFIFALVFVFMLLLVTLAMISSPSAN